MQIRAYSNRHERSVLVPDVESEDYRPSNAQKTCRVPNVRSNFPLSYTEIKISFPAMTQLLAQRFSLRRTLCVLMLVLTLVVITLLMTSNYDAKAFILGRGNIKQIHIMTDSEGHYLALPPEVVKAGLYKNGSFANKAGVVPVFWEGKGNYSSSPDRRPNYGPCYAYTKRKVNWVEQIQKFNLTGEHFKDFSIRPNSNLVSHENTKWKTACVPFNNNRNNMFQNNDSVAISKDPVRCTVL